MRSPLRATFTGLALALALAGAPSCINVSPPGTAFASEPPGARVHVDGHDSGWVTPCLIALDVDESHVVRIELAGHAAREILLVPDSRQGVVSFAQAKTGTRSTLSFPTRLPAVDFVFPLREIQTLAPGRVFVRLRPESAALPETTPTP